MPTLFLKPPPRPCVQFQRLCPSRTSSHIYHQQVRRRPKRPVDQHIYLSLSSSSMANVYDEQEEDVYRDIVENGPDLFSLHGTTLDAPFSFVSESLNLKFQLPSGYLLGKPLKTVVDPDDWGVLTTALLAVLGPNPTSGGKSGNGRDGGGSGGIEGIEGVGGAGAEAAAPAAAAAVGSGTVVELNVMCGGASCLASMSIAFGCRGLIVVTRLQ